MNYTNTQAHLKLLKTLGDILPKVGYPIILIGVLDVATGSHQPGILKFDRHPTDSVLDTFCRSHDLKNLFVVDGCLFSSSTTMNSVPTILAPRPCALVTGRGRLI